MILLYLFLAHFIGDFILQPSRLVAWKNRSWKGVFVHVSIHFLVTSLLLYLYLGKIEVLLLALPLSTMHFFIDLLKASHQKKGREGVFAYWLDQILHYLSIILIFLLSGQMALISNSAWQPAWLFAIYTSPALIIYLCLAVFVTYAVEYSYFPDRERSSQNNPSLKAKHFISRLFFLTLIYLGIIFALPALFTFL